MLVHHDIHVHSVKYHFEITLGISNIQPPHSFRGSLYNEK